MGTKMLHEYSTATAPTGAEYALIDQGDGTYLKISLDALKTLILAGKTMPAAGELLTTTATATLTNKIIDASGNTLLNLTDAAIKAGASIDATKLGKGNVTSDELSQLTGVKANIQAQLNSSLSVADKPLQGLVHPAVIQIKAAATTEIIKSEDIQAALGWKDLEEAINADTILVQCYNIHKVPRTKVADIEVKTKAPLGTECLDAVYLYNLTSGESYNLVAMCTQINATK